MGKGKKAGSAKPATGAASGEGGAAAGSGAAACANCGIRSAGLKKCARCLQVAYCSKECQQAAWKGHKTSCHKQEPQLPIEDIRGRVGDAIEKHDWAELFKWESRLDEILEVQNEENTTRALGAYADAYHSTDQFDKAGPMYVRFAEACGALELSSMQIKALCAAGTCYMNVGDQRTGILWFQAAADVSTERGLLLSESNMCVVAGSALKEAWRRDEAVAQLRRALAAVERFLGKDPHAPHTGLTAKHKFDPHENPRYLEQVCLRELVEALGMAGHLEEAEATFQRLRERGARAGGSPSVVWDNYLEACLHANRDNRQDSMAALQAALDGADSDRDPHAEGALRMAKAFFETAKGRLEGDAAPQQEIRMAQEAWEAGDCAEVLRWERRVEEIFGENFEAMHPDLLEAFATSNFDQGLFAKATSWYEKRVDALGKVERFRDQGENMCRVGQCWVNLSDGKKAETWFLRAWELAERHGFFSAECGASLGMGHVQQMKGNSAAAEERFRHALMVLDFVEEEDEKEQLHDNTSRALATLLLDTERFEEAGPYVLRLRDVSERNHPTLAGAPHKVLAFSLAVRFQVGRGDVEQAAKEMQALEDFLRGMPEGAQKDGCAFQIQQARESFTGAPRS